MVAGISPFNSILAHEDVEAVSFVRSAPIARYVHKTASANGARVQALGGAKNHMVVMRHGGLRTVDLTRPCLANSARNENAGGTHIATPSLGWVLHPAQPGSW
ncbi:aldehyde dehydrogenase family protein [Streptomyces rugosispiralis]|uniref:Aldehyde dehydrogenase family protein n=1 Tax=Streptomyces rugosispiralis TaxID=2967341 RepID=A0ABT1VA51_9ACTN|nr:aldehyde dehydrogenase family protein [Streptomyces rugosispiralis]MCQ8193873.1 aldehyde dehydrogenase family protein [Streptomyces rugosispiralis]